MPTTALPDQTSHTQDRAGPGAPHHRHTRRPTKEVTHPMQLTALLDFGSTATLTEGEIPCQSNDPELWFADTPEGVEFAKALCVSCPMIEACLDGALSRREAAGVWGGQYFVDGVVVARKRPRGRPRKDSYAA